MLYTYTRTYTYTNTHTHTSIMVCFIGLTAGGCEGNSGGSWRPKDMYIYRDTYAHLYYSFYTHIHIYLCIYIYV